SWCAPTVILAMVRVSNHRSNAPPLDMKETHERRRLLLRSILELLRQGFRERGQFIPISQNVTGYSRTYLSYRFFETPILNQVNTLLHESHHAYSNREEEAAYNYASAMSQRLYDTAAFRQYLRTYIDRPSEQFLQVLSLLYNPKDPLWHFMYQL